MAKPKKYITSKLKPKRKFVLGGDPGQELYLNNNTTYQAVDAPTAMLQQQFDANEQLKAKQNTAIFGNQLARQMDYLQDQNAASEQRKKEEQTARQQQAEANKQAVNKQVTQTAGKAGKKLFADYKAGTLGLSNTNMLGNSANIFSNANVAAGAPLSPTVGPNIPSAMQYSHSFISSNTPLTSLNYSPAAQPSAINSFMPQGLNQGVVNTGQAVTNTGSSFGQSAAAIGKSVGGAALVAAPAIVGQVASNQLNKADDRQMTREGRSQYFDDTDFSRKEFNAQMLKSTGQGATIGGTIASAIPIPGVATGAGMAIGAVVGAGIGLGKAMHQRRMTKTEDERGVKIGNKRFGKKLLFGEENAYDENLDPTVIEKRNREAQLRAMTDTATAMDNARMGSMMQSDLNTGFNLKSTSGQMAKYGGKLEYLKGGVAKSLGRGAKEYVGKKHEQGGIDLPGNIEVEGGETEQNNYIFSATLKLPTGLTYAQTHKNLLASGASSEEIKQLALSQEAAAGRNPNEIKTMKFAKYGGPIQYKKGGNTEPPIKVTGRSKEYWENLPVDCAKNPNQSGCYKKPKDFATSWLDDAQRYYNGNLADETINSKLSYDDFLKKFNIKSSRTVSSDERGPRTIQSREEDLIYNIKSINKELDNPNISEEDKAYYKKNLETIKIQLQNLDKGILPVPSREEYEFYRGQRNTPDSEIYNPANGSVIQQERMSAELPGMGTAVEFNTNTPAGEYSAEAAKNVPQTKRGREMFNTLQNKLKGRLDRQLDRQNTRVDNEFGRFNKKISNMTESQDAADAYNRLEGSVEFHNAYVESLQESLKKAKETGKDTAKIEKELTRFLHRQDLLNKMRTSASNTYSYLTEREDALKEAKNNPPVNMKSKDAGRLPRTQAPKLAAYTLPDVKEKPTVREEYLRGDSYIGNVFNVGGDYDLNGKDFDKLLYNEKGQLPIFGSNALNTAAGNIGTRTFASKEAEDAFYSQYYFPPGAYESTVNDPTSIKSALFYLNDNLGNIFTPEQKKYVNNKYALKEINKYLPDYEFTVDANGKYVATKKTNTSAATNQNPPVTNTQTQTTNNQPVTANNNPPVNTNTTVSNTTDNKPSGTTSYITSDKVTASKTPTGKPRFFMGASRIVDENGNVQIVTDRPLMGQGNMAGSRLGTPTEQGLEDVRSNSYDAAGNLKKDAEYKNTKTGANLSSSDAVNDRETIAGTEWGKRWGYRPGMSAAEAKSAHNAFASEMNTKFDQSPDEMLGYYQYLIDSGKVDPKTGKRDYTGEDSFGDDARAIYENLQSKGYIDANGKIKSEALPYLKTQATNEFVGPIHNAAGAYTLKGKPAPVKIPGEVPETPETPETPKKPLSELPPPPKYVPTKSTNNIGLLQTIPAAYAAVNPINVKPIAPSLAMGYVQPGAVGRTNIGRVSYNTERAANQGNLSAMNQALQNMSGPGAVAGMLAAKTKADQQSLAIANAEQNQNVGLAAKEADLNAGISKFNVGNAMQAQTTNAGIAQQNAARMQQASQFNTQLKYAKDVENREQMLGALDRGTAAIVQNNLANRQLDATERLAGIYDAYSAYNRYLDATKKEEDKTNQVAKFGGAKKYISRLGDLKNVKYKV